MDLPLALFLLFAEAENPPEKLLQTLGEGGPKERREARKKLLQLGPAAREAVKQALHSPEPQIAEAAKDLWAELKWQISPGFQSPPYRDALAAGDDHWDESWKSLAEKSPLLFARLLALCGDQVQVPAENEESAEWSRLSQLGQVAVLRCSAPELLSQLDEKEIKVLAEISREHGKIFSLEAAIRRGDLPQITEALIADLNLLESRLKDTALMEKMGRQDQPGPQALHLLSLRHQPDAFAAALAKLPDAWLGQLPQGLVDIFCRELAWPAAALAVTDAATARRIAAPSQSLLLRLLPENPGGFAAICRLQLLRLQGNGRADDWQKLHLRTVELHISALDPWIAPSDIPVCDAYDFGIMKLAALDLDAEVRQFMLPEAEIDRLRLTFPPAAASARDALRTAQLQGSTEAIHAAALALATAAPDCALALCLAADQFPPRSADNQRLLLRAAEKCRSSTEGEILAGSICVGRNPDAARLLLKKFANPSGSTLSDPAHLALLCGEPIPSPSPLITACLEAKAELLTAATKELPVKIPVDTLLAVFSKQKTVKSPSTAEIQMQLHRDLAQIPLDNTNRDRYLSWCWLKVGLEEVAAGRAAAGIPWLELSQRNADGDDDSSYIAELALRRLDSAKPEPQP